MNRPRRGLFLSSSFSSSSPAGLFLDGFSGVLARGLALAPTALLEPVAVAVHLEDMDFVGQPIEQCAGQTLGAEDFGPFVERQIAGYEDRGPLIASAEHLEQELRAGLGQRHVAELIDDQELVAGELLVQAQQPFLVAGFHELMHQSGGGGEPDRESLLAGGEAETERNVGLARAGVAERDQVLLSR